jgi:WD40 repeat protein
VRETNGELTPEFEATLKKRIKNTVDKLAQSMLSKSFVKDKMNNHKKHQYPVLPASSEGSLDDSDSSLCSFPLLNGRKLKPARTSDDDSSLSPKSQTFASIKKGSNSSSSTSLTPDVINSTASCRNGSFRSQTHPLHLPQTGKRKKALRKRKSYDLSTLGRQKLVKWYNPEITPIQKRITDLNHQINDLRLAGLDHKTSRPYLSSSALDDIQKGINEVASSDESKNRAEVEASAIEGQLIHVDFSNEELCYIEATIGSVIKQPRNLNLGIAARIERLLNQNRAHVAEFLRVLSARKGNSSQKNRYLQNRTTEDIAAFFEDAMAGRISKRPQTIRFSMKPRPLRSSSRISSNISAILRGREVFENPRRFEQDLSIRTRILTYMEDTFSREAEWSDCSGDITTITCLPDDLFICGAITHSDLHNQQYNKPGNLLLGSADKRTLKSIPGHRIPRPIVLKGDNALPSMRQTQDPWLYSSVTCTAYDHISKYCFTGSFDHTVKIWNFSSNDSNANFDIQGTWPHDGVVNFVVTSPYHGKIATAADIVQNAIRVYTLDTLDVSASSFISYSGERADEQCLGRRDKPQTWAYYPATLHWGRAPTVAHLLLAGYSPRGFDPNIPDIPDDKVNTGELCLWDTNTRVRIPISAARTQNVFEVVWHPTQPIFIAATSAAGYLEDGVQTQLRLFGQAEHGMFTLLKTLDCPAFDINEVTIMYEIRLLFHSWNLNYINIKYRPNSQLYAYVTASCTNGVTYVWDSAQDEHPIQILRHGRKFYLVQSNRLS